MSYVCVNMTKIFFLLWFHCLVECWWLENQKCICAFLIGHLIISRWQKSINQWKHLIFVKYGFHNNTRFLLTQSTLTMTQTSWCYQAYFQAGGETLARKSSALSQANIGNIVVMVSNNKINIILDLICKAFQCKL